MKESHSEGVYIVWFIFFFLSTKQTKTVILVSLQDGFLAGKGYREVSEGTDNVLFLDLGTC